VQSGSFMAYVDGTAVNLALPTMLVEFNIDIETVKWVTVAYLLAITVSLLSVGRLADLFGRKRLTMLGFAVFTTGSVLCAIARSFELLVAFRVLQGLGAACLMANGLAIIGALFAPEERGRAMSVQPLTSAIATMAGPVLAGALIAAFGWRAIFLLNLPIGLFGLALSVAILNEARISKPRDPEERFDFAGAILSAAALGALFWALEVLADEPLSPGGLLLLVAGLVLVAAFFVVERRVRTPLLHLPLFRARQFSLGSFAVACALVASSAIMFALPFYLELVLGYSPLQTGLLLMPTAIAVVFAGPLGGWLSSRVSAHILASGGLSLVAVAGVWLAMLRADSPYSHVALGLIALGIGLGFFFPPNYVSVMSVVPSERLGIAAAFLSTMRMLGQFVGASLTAEILGGFLEPVGGLESVGQAGTRAGQEPVADAFMVGQSTALGVTAAIALAGVLGSALRGDSAKDPPSPAADAPGATRARGANTM